MHALFMRIVPQDLYIWSVDFAQNQVIKTSHVQRRKGKLHVIIEDQEMHRSHH